MPLQATRPFVTALFKGVVTVDGKEKQLTIAKVNNYAGVVDHEGREVATRKSVNELLAALVSTSL